LEDDEILIERPKTRSSTKDTNLKKRKPGEDLPTAPPPKFMKSNKGGKSGRGTVKVPPAEAVRVINPNKARNEGHN
jgi:hypothetical protein